MQTYKNLPGVTINELDGGLNTTFQTDDAVLVLGTSGTGVINTPYQGEDLGATATLFGFNGSLFRGLAEASTYSENVIGYRIGTTPMQLQGVGVDTLSGSTTPGFTITFSDVTADAATRYKIWYATGVLAVWKDNQIQFSNQAGLPSTLATSRSPALRG